MGSMDYDSTRKASSAQRGGLSKVSIALLVVTNLISIFLFSGSGFFGGGAIWDSGKLVRELNITRAQLSASHAELADLHRRLGTANALLETLIADTANVRSASEQSGGSNNVDGGAWGRELAGELKEIVGPHKLPLGFTPNIGSDELYPALGQACRQFQDELEQYMNYSPGDECPSDDVFAQRLMLKGCEPLPRRRCHPKSPVGYVEPTPFPESLWSIPADTSITWDAYTCKNYKCLLERGNKPGSYDCKDCFNLFGREQHRWMEETSEVDYSIANVLKLKPKGTIRIGLDIGGGTASFAARMRELNITIITTSMNFDGPFNSFIASRGLVPMHISVAHRLPFFDNTLDIVHSMHVLSNWIPDVMLEFALFDIYRVLRPGGLFWLDRFFCLGNQLNATYVPIFDRVGFRRIRWNAGRKLDRGIQMNEWYLSAILEKPMT